MKKLILSVALIATMGYADNGSDSSDYYFGMGYKKGKIVGYRKGFEAGKKEALKELNKRFAEIKAMEAGKYLVKQYKITAPKVFQKKMSDGSIKVVIDGCKLEKELTPEEIMLLPKMPNGYKVSSSYGGYNPSVSQKAISDSVYLPGVDTEDNIPHGTEEVNDITYLILPNTEYYKKLLDKAGKPFSISADGKIRVLFQNHRDKMLFINHYELKAGEDYIQ
jgi:hypothetical protein